MNEAAPTEERARPRVEQAFAQARREQAKVRAMSLHERLAAIDRVRAYLLEHHEALADRIVAGTGKARFEAVMMELYGLLDLIHTLQSTAPAQLADRKVATPLSMMGKRSMILYEPLGTVLVISPWNVPFYQALAPCLTAFVAGNSVVYKPSEHTPLEGLVEQVLGDSGFPREAVQVVYGDGAVGEQLIRQRPDKIFFTGSVRTGKRIMAQAAEHLIPVELELGGKDPMLVFDDVDLERTSAGALWGAFNTTGQQCTSVERLYVQDRIYRELVDRLARGADALVLGSGADADVGPMIVRAQLAIVEAHVQDAVAKGARVLTARRWDGASLAYPPMVLVDVDHTMRIMREETFGPVLPVMRFATEEEAVQLANDSEYGLSASVWSRDLERAERVARRIVTGNVSVNNVMLTEGNAHLPFGGVKHSGFGRTRGEIGLHGFCNVKSVMVDKQSKKIEANWFPYTATKYRLFVEAMKGAFGRGAGAFVRFVRYGMGLESHAQRPRPNDAAPGKDA